MDGVCRLCHLPAELQQSHVIPAFVFRWRKDTSPTPHMRLSTNPNQRVQDGIKKPWLCSDCEQKLGAVEQRFASEIFLPITQQGNHRIGYGDWLLKFCVSISWRLLLLAKEETSFSDLTETERTLAEKALSVWRDFLCGHRPHPEQFEQHLIVFEEIGSYRGQLPPNMNRHLLRSIDIDLARGDGFSFTYAKMGPFAILGFLEMQNIREWSGGKVRVRSGWVGPREYAVPPSFYEYLVRRAKREAALMADLSDRQRAIADAATEAGIQRNIEKLRGSNWARATLRDVEMFGDEALSPGTKKV